jgi:hypothetical protein
MAGEEIDSIRQSTFSSRAAGLKVGLRERQDDHFAG